MADVHTCEECGKRLATIGGLEIHMAMAHGEAAPAPHEEPDDVELQAFARVHDEQPAMASAPWPPAAPAPTRPVPPPRKPLFGGVDPAEPLAWVLTVLLFLGAVVAAIHHPHPPSDVTNAAAVSAVPQTTTTTLDPAQEDALLKTVLPSPQELGAWTVKDTRTVSVDELTAPDPCLADPSLTQSTAGEQQRLQLSQGRPLPAQLSISVATTPSSTVAGAQLAVVNKPEYAGCAVKDLEAGLRGGGGGALHIRNTAAVAPTARLPLSGAAYKFVTTAYNDNGLDLVITTDDYVLVSGRLVAHLLFASIRTPLAQASEDQVIQALARHMTEQSGR